MVKRKLAIASLVALLLSGCAMGPHMRMSTPSNESDYNGVKVYLHSIDEGDFGTSVVAENAQNGTADISELVTDSMPNMEYRIGPLDVIQVIVWEHPELSTPSSSNQVVGQKVSPDGTIFFPYAGELMVVGKTVQEVRAEITQRLSSRVLNNPQVDVVVVDYKSLKAFAAGEVKSPGYVYFSESPMTLPMAVAEAGGFSPYADPAGMQLRRGDKVYNINYLDAFKNNLPLERILLKPEDQLYVPSLVETQKQNRAYVMGEVQKPGLVDLIGGKGSLVEVLATAGGLQAVNASSRSIYVIRNTSESRIDVFHLNAKNAMALAMAERFDLNAKDIVYVDASGLATWNRLISLILPSVQTVYYGTLVTRNIQLINNSGWE